MMYVCTYILVYVDIWHRHCSCPQDNDEQNLYFNCLFLYPNNINVMIALQFNIGCGVTAVHISEVGLDVKLEK